MLNARIPRKPPQKPPSTLREVRVRFFMLHLSLCSLDDPFGSGFA